MKEPKAFYTGGKLFLLNIALGLGTFIQILDSSIANVAIPYIAGSMSVSADEGTWVITSFSASNAIVLPLTGWLSDYFGRVKLFCWSVILFAFTSLLCGLSQSLTMLIVLRVAQGAVAGSLIPLSQSLLLANNPPDRQGSALGFWAMVVIVAPVLGPILGGYLTETYSWPWIFYINVPLGLFSAAITWHMLSDRETEITRNPIDWVGLFFLAFGVACLQVMLDKGQDLDWFESNVIITLCVFSICSIAYFIVWNYYEKFPIVDFSFFRDRNFTLGTLVTTIGYLIYFGSTVTVPLWLQTQMNYDAYWAGVAVAPVGIFPVIFSAWIGKNLYRVDLRAVSSLSFFLFAIAFFYQSNFTPQVSLEVIMFSRFIQGMGVAIFFIPLIQISLGNVPPARMASASGLFNFIRILVGSGFGTSLSVYLWNRLAIFHHSRLSETVTNYSPLTVEAYQALPAQHPFISTSILDRLMEMALEMQAYVLSTNDMSWLAAWIFILMIPIPFICNKVSMNHPGSVAAE